MSECKDFQKFCEEVADRIPDYLLQFHIDRVRIETITKNNGVTLTGLIIAIKESKIVPNVYLEFYYNKYQMGNEMEDILREIAQEYCDMYDQLLQDGIKSDYLENVDKKIFLKLVNFEKNKEMLEDIPYIPFFDMAITFRFLVRQDDRGVASALVRNREFDLISMTLEEMYQQALENTKNLFPYEIRPLAEIIKQSFCKEFVPEIDTEIYVLSNCQYINGATYLLYDEILFDFARKNGGDFFIIPSSVHELLLCPKDLGMDRDFLQNILKEANESVVSQIDFLSDSVLEFCVEDGGLRI